MDSKFTSNPNFVWGIRKKWSHGDLLTPPDSKMGGAYRKRLLRVRKMISKFGNGDGTVTVTGEN